MLGELRYCKKHMSLDDAHVAYLDQCCELLAQSLLIYEPDLDLTQLKPIRYSPPEPLPAAALTRAVLTELRVAAAPLATAALAHAVAQRNGIAIAERGERLAKRVRRTLNYLVSKGIVKCIGDLWALSF